MQGELLTELLNTVNNQIFTLVLQLIVTGAIFMWIKDMNGRIVNFIRLKMSDFGRGTQVIIDGQTGYINRISFNEVEIIVDEDQTMFIPVERFIKSTKIIIAKRIHANRDSK